MKTLLCVNPSENFIRKIGKQNLLVFFALLVLFAHFAVASDAIIAYSSDTGSGSNYPKIKFWNSTGSGSWGSEIELPSSGSEVHFAIVKSSPVSSKVVLVTLSNNDYLDGYVCMANCTNVTNWKNTTRIGHVSGSDERRFDLEFESATGDAIVVYSNFTSSNISRDMAYKVLPNASRNFTGITEQYINDSGHPSVVNTYTWLRLDRNPINTSEELILVGYENDNDDINAWVWSGNSWGNQTEISSNASQTDGSEALAVRYAADGSKGMALGGNASSGNVDYRFWNGASWSAVSSFDINSTNTNDVHWLNLKADPATDDLQTVAADSADDLHTAYWNGTAWNVTSNIETDLATSGLGNIRPADFDWNPSGSTGKLVWGTDSSANLRQRTCSPQCTGSTTTISTYGGSSRFITLYRNPTDSDTVDILGAKLNRSSTYYYLGSFTYNGTNFTNYGDRNITDQGLSASDESYSIAFLGVSAPIVSSISVLKLSQTALQPSPGGIVQFNMTITNTGGATLNVTVLDTLPAGLTFASSYPTNNSYTAPRTYDWNFTLNAGNSFVIYLNATVDAGIANSTNRIVNLTNYMNATGKPPTGSNVTAESRANVTVYYANDSTVEVNLTALVASQGGIVQYLINVTNTGNVTLNITVNDTIDNALSYNASSPAGTSIGQNVNWTLASVLPGETRQLYLNASVKNYPSGCQNTVNNVTIKGIPPNGNNVTANTSLIVPVCLANVSVLKLDQTAAQPSPGGLVQFNLTITNNGNVVLNPVSIYDTLPTGLTLISGTGPFTQNGQTLNWTTSLASGASTVIYLNATVNAGIANSTNRIVNLTNYMNATGKPPNGNNVTAETRANVTVYYANDSVVKVNLTAQIASQGGIVQYLINVTNTGNVTLNITVNDTIDNALSYNASSPPGTSIGQNVNWTLANVLPGETRQLYLNTSVKNYPSGCQNTVNNVSIKGIPPNGNNVTATATLNVPVCLANISVLKLDQTAAQPSPGGLVQFNLTITNNGNVTLNPTSVADVLPAGLTYISSYPAADSPGQTSTWNNVGSLSPGASAVVYLNATVNSGVVDSTNRIVNLTNYMNATGKPPNGNNVTAESRANVTVYYANDSVVKINLTAQIASQGGIVQYLINVTNTGNVTLNITVNDTLDSMLTYNSTDTLPVTVNGQVVSWTFAGIAPGASQQMLLNASVSTTPTGCQNTVNNVSVVGVPPNGASVNASFSLTVPVCLANVSVLKLDQTAAQPSPGGLVQFNLTITNNGNVTLNPIAIFDVLPAGLTLDGATAPYDQNGQTINWTISLASGASAVFYLNATVDDGIVDASTPLLNLTNHANASGVPPNGDTVQAENDKNVTIYYANISIIKVDITPVMTSPGGMVQWLITISNPGEVSLNPVFVTDNLPAGFQYSNAVPSASSVSLDGREINWTNVGPIGPGGNVQLYLNSSVGEVANGTYTNDVSTIGEPPNGDEVGDSDSAQIGIFAPAITVTKNVSSASVQMNKNATFNLFVLNTGQTNLTVTIVDVLPQNVTFRGATIPPTSIIGQVVTWDSVSLIAPGASFEISYNVSANRSGTYANNVTVFGQPPNGYNASDGDSATFIVTVPPSPSSGGAESESKTMRLEYDFICPGNKVVFTSTGSGDPLADVEIRVMYDEPPSFYVAGDLTSGGDGHSTISLSSIGTYKVKASKGGYNSIDTEFDFTTCAVAGCASNNDCNATSQCLSGQCSLVPCSCGTVANHACAKYACCSDQDCPANNSCQNHACAQQFQCTKNSDCTDTQYCDIATGAAGGGCRDVTGCGTVSNHVLAPYQCGDGLGCPSCLNGEQCENHQCISRNLTAPANASVGSNVTVHATEMGKPCPLCDVKIILPDGTTINGKTDANGNYVLPMGMPGTYTVELMKNGVLIKTITVKALGAPSQPPPSGTTKAENPPNYCLPAALILSVILLAIIWTKRKEIKEMLGMGKSEPGYKKK